MAELRAAAQLDAHPLADELLLELADEAGDVRDVDEEVAAHVRRGHDRACALGGRGGRKLDAFVERGRAVVYARQCVEMDIRSVHMPGDSANRLLSR